MSIENLISYPEVNVYATEMLEAFENDAVSGKALLEYGVVNKLRSTISVRLLEGGVNPVFVVGEALQSYEDDFSKSIGKSISDDRALVLRPSKQNKNWLSFSLSEALELEPDPLGRVENYDVVQVSTVKLPISGLPLPHGIVNRLRMLLPR